MDRNEDIRRVIWDSGLWASYGDAAEVMDGYHGRSLAQANWHPDRWTHLARADGTYDAETTSKEREFRNRTDVLAVQSAYGYPAGEPKPARLRLSPEDIRQLIGERPVTDHLLRRLRGQLTTISAVLQTTAADDRDVSALSAAQGRLAQLIERLEGTEPDGEADVPNGDAGTTGARPISLDEAVRFHIQWSADDRALARQVIEWAFSEYPSLHAYVPPANEVAVIADERGRRLVTFRQDSLRIHVATRPPFRGAAAGTTANTWNVPLSRPRS